MFIAIAVIAALAILPGCANDETPNTRQPAQQTPAEQKADQNQTNKDQNQANDDEKDTPASLGGISLKSSLDEVEAKLGKKFGETTHTEPGYFPEAWVERNYNKEISIIYGKNSKEIYQIYTTSSKYRTNLGVKVGDNAKEVFNKYSELFDQFESRQGEGLLPGFFELGDGEIIIFDLDVDDNTILNKEPAAESKVEAIRITKTDYLD